MTEPDHIPAPAEHAPRKESAQQMDSDLTVYEAERPAETYLFSDYSVEVTQ